MKGTRLTLSAAQMKQIYPLIGGKIQELRKWQHINDKRPSEIAEEVAGLELIEDLFSEAIRKAETAP